MKIPHSYVLVLDQSSEDLQRLEKLLQPLRCPLVVVNSVEQVIARAMQSPPYLIILAGNSQLWSRQLVDQIRQLTNACGVTILAMTDCHAPSWMPQEDNPGVDGFLVKPISGDVLLSLVQSAWARQSFCVANS